MHNRHILQRIMQCVLYCVYIVICNTVRHHCRESYVTGRYCYGALWFF